MTLKLLILLATLLAVGISTPSRDRNNKPFKVICYWGSWTFYRSGLGHSVPENTDPNLCTHMMYGFAKLNDDHTMAVMEPDLDLGDTDWNSGLPWGRGMYRRFNKMREINPHLTTLISLGGWNEGSDKYSVMASSAHTRKIFVDSVVKFLDTYDFDGLDFDWEYPATQAGTGGQDRLPGKDEDKENFIYLLRELKAALHPKGYLLTAAVPAGRPTIDRGYHVKEVSELLDFINLMTYDFHGGWDEKTGHNAPLHPSAGAEGIDLQFTTEYAVDYWISLGADPKKLIMGIPLYGRTFTLASPSESGLGAKTIGKGGRPGQYTQVEGHLGYNEICEMLRTNQWTIYRDQEQKIPYAVSGNQWIGYDDIASIKDKLAFLKDRQLGGAVVWSIDTDDFNDVCGGGKFPLMRTIFYTMDGQDIIVPDDILVPTPKPIGPEGPGEEQQPGTAFKCKSEGFFADPEDKTQFHHCVDNGNGQYTDYVKQCPIGTIFYEDIKACNY